MKKFKLKRYFLFLVFLGIFILWKFNFVSNNSSLPHSANPQISTPNTAMALPAQTSLTSPPLKIESLDKKEEISQNLFLAKKLESFDAPESSTYRDEVEADPHTTPNSLLTFARDLTPHVERGLSVKSYAPAVMDFLEKCALGQGPSGEGTPSAAKASCLVNASRLQRAHPEIFSERFEALKTNVSTHVLKLARGIGLRE